MDIQAPPNDPPHMEPETTRRRLDELLATARARICRLEPADALAATDSGALVIDIRSDADRDRDGIVPGSLHIPRTVLEWRLDLDSPWRNPHVAGFDQHLLLLCDHGYSSSLAAATLLDLGFTSVGDVIGGYAAWREAGLPTTAAPPHRRAAGEPAGMRPPDA
jgi:rhodanese-related sulfurtransferase